MISEDIFSRLLLVSGEKNLNGLSKILGKTESWAASTKKRKGIPFEACAEIAKTHSVSMDYLLFGIKTEEAKLDINEIKVSITEGIFASIQQEMIVLNEGIKISTIANAIANEIIENCDLKTNEDIKKAI